MKHIWNVHGTYFEWELTVKVRPADEAPVPITESQQSSALVRMKQLGDLFHDAADLHEFRIGFDALSRPGLG